LFSSKFHFFILLGKELLAMPTIRFSGVFFFLGLVCFSQIIRGQEIDSDKELKYESTIQDTGDVILYALPAAAGLTTLITGDKEGSWQFLKSFGTNLAVTQILKYGINKNRPEGATDGHAFPSGHTSVTFQSASFIQRRYGWKYGIPAYALAGFVGYSRIEGIDNRHDGWDVLAGAIVGITSSYIFTTPYQKEHFDIGFRKIDMGSVIVFKYKF